MVAYFHYSTSISINTKNLDIIDLAERCELLTDILIDSVNPAECAALCNYVYAHIGSDKRESG